MLDTILVYLVPGIIYGIGSIGLALTFRYLRFPDFSVLGSIMFGGILCVCITNLTNCYIGLFAGFVGGGFIGCITGLLVYKLKIERVLAGIITFTASYSFGYFFAENGTIELENASFLSSTFQIMDLLVVSLIAVFICIIIHILMKTKLGSLLLAMTASKEFLKVRHRNQGIIFLITVAAGNSIVGLAGALYALRIYSAHVISHADFLPFSLGAIFGGNALTLLLINKINKSSVPIAKEENVKSNPQILFHRFKDLISVERDETSRVGYIFLVYVVGCLFIKVLSGLVYSNAFENIHPAISFPSNLQYFIVAVLLAISVWIAGSIEE